MAGPLAVHLGMAVLLAAGHRVFTARVRGGAWVLAGATFLGTLGIGVLLGWVLLALFPGTVPADSHLAWAAAQVAGLGFGDTATPVNPPPG